MLRKLFCSRETDLWFAREWVVFCAASPHFLPTQIICGFSRVGFCRRRLAPRAGAGTYFRGRTKVSKGLPKDTFGRPLGELPLIV